MLAEFEEITSRAEGPGRDRLDVEMRNAARALIDRQFIFSDDFQGRRRFELIRRHRSYFESLFDALGFDLLVDDREQMVGIVSQSGTSARRMTLNESLFLVALRVVYEERVKAFDMKEAGRCDTTLAEVWGLVEERSGRERPSAPKCRAIAEAFARNGIVRMGDTLPEGDIALEIRPVIARAASAETANAIERYALQDANGLGADESADPDTEAAAPDSEEMETE